MKKLSFLFISFIGIIVVGIPLYDIIAFYENKSLICPLNEFIYQLAIPNQKYWDPIVKIPLTNDILRTAVSHVHRGKCKVDVWIPERMKDFTEIKEDIKIKCIFEKNNESNIIFPPKQTYIRYKHLFNVLILNNILNKVKLFIILYLLYL